MAAPPPERATLSTSPTRSLRLAFFGTPDFAVPTLERLIAGHHTVTAVVSQPDRRRGRGRALTPSPVAAIASASDITLLRPEHVAEDSIRAALAALDLDLGVVVAFGQFLPKQLRELPRAGYLINGHASLLPKWRGAAPIARAIEAGERETGICAMRVEKEMDAGPVALRRAIPIGPNENAGELTSRLCLLCADVIEEVVDAVANGSVEWTEQDDGAATLAPKIERAETRIDWHRPALELAHRIRAFAPTPGAFTTWQDSKLTIHAASPRPAHAMPAPGTVVRGEDGALQVATSDGWLVLERLQRAGGKALPVEEFLRGRPIPDGTLFGAPAPAG